MNYRLYSGMPIEGQPMACQALNVQAGDRLYIYTSGVSEVPMISRVPASSYDKAAKSFLSLAGLTCVLPTSSGPIMVATWLDNAQAPQIIMLESHLERLHRYPGKARDQEFSVLFVFSLVPLEPDDFDQLRNCPAVHIKGQRALVVADEGISIRGGTAEELLRSHPLHECM